MLKRLSKIILVIAMLLSLVFGQGSTVVAASQDDIVTIKTRLKNYFLELDTIDDGAKVETCYVSKAEDYLKRIEADGSFGDVDYQAHNNAANGAAWSPYLALDRLQAIAIAYHKEGNSLYHSDAAKNGLDKALKNWVTHGKRNGKPDGPYSSNWWENEVGVQLRFARIGLFMEGIISQESFQIIIDKLVEKEPVKKGTGQNNLWFDQNHVYQALLTNNAKRLKEMVNDYLNYCLSTQLDDKTAEAVQVDNSFYMHGKQFYSNGYGMSMFRDMSFWIYILRGTEFAIGQDVVDRMADYMLDGTSWTIRGDIMELYLGYRPYKFDVEYKNYAEEYIEPIKRMIAADPSRADEYQKVLNNIQDPTQSNGKNGNYYMWRSGYASHMRDDYGVNIKMDSKDIIGGEWRGSTNQYGQLIYWTSSATSTITVDGDEYTSVYPVYDWAHCPGATTASRIVEDFSNYGRFTNGTDHTIGVSNGTYGSTAYVMDKKGTQATKGYFFFDDEFVALGSGIHSTEKVAIHTTLNQSKAVDTKVDGTAVSKGTVGREYTAKSIYNNKIGYIFLDDTKVKVSYDDQKGTGSLWADEQKETANSVFTAYLDHGLNPKDASYAYVVTPNKTASEVENYANSVPVIVVANNANVQAVRHDGLKQTQVNFYKAGSLEYKNGYTVTVDQPCNMIIDESGMTRKITVAVNDKAEQTIINVNIAHDSAKSTTKFISQPIPYAGQSQTLSEGQDIRYAASSSTDNHPASYVFDGKDDTYWESETKNEEWVSVFTNTDSYIASLDILWGEHFAEDYDVYVSQNGKDYEKINSVTDGKGNTENVNIGRFAHYIKIVMKSGNSSNYQLKELKLHEGELISLNKPTQTSSVSSKAPTFVGGFAVDGNSSTRWASSRDSDDEWITVDLQGHATMNAVEIDWENACSDDYEIQVSNDNKTWTTLKKLKTDISLKDSVYFAEEVTGCYLRVHSLKSRIVDGVNYGINIFEIKIYGNIISEPELEDVNIALDRPSVASSEFVDKNNGNKVYPSSLAFDGKTGTVNGQQSRWTSNRGTDDEWIVVDLEDTYAISKIVLNWEGNSAHEYKVLVSEDQQNWKEVESVSGEKGIKEITIDEAVNGRYVKMQGVKVGGKYGYSLWEFEVYGKLISMNRALNRPSVASSEFTNPNTKFKFESKYAFDGSTEDRKDAYQSRWVSDRKKDNPNTDVSSQYIYVDLEDTYAISKVILNWEGACATKYKIQVSDNAQEWKDVSDITDGKAGIRELTYDEPVAGRYVRMLASEAAGIYGYSLWEFEVYGTTLKTDLKAFYDSNKNINTSLYTPKSVEPYQTALENVYKVYKDKDATTSQITSVKTALKTAIEGLLKRADKEALNETIKTAEAIDKSLYIAKSVEALEIALEKAKELSKDENAVQNKTDQMKNDLQKVIDELVLKTDKSALNETIKIAKAIDMRLYVSQSVEALEKAIKEAQTVADNEDATQSEAEQAIKNLQDIIDGLTLKGDKKALNETINVAETIDKAIYTDESLKALDIVLEKAKTVSNNADAIQSEVDQVLKDLQNIIQLLEKKPNEPIIIPDENKEMTIQSSDKNVNVVGKLPDGIELASKVLNNDEVKQLRILIGKMNSEFLKDKTLEKIFDLSLLYDGHIYQISNTIEISLKLDDNLLNKKLGIIYIDKNGNIQKIDSKVESGYIKFNVDHLSQYAIISYQEKTNEDSNQVDTSDTSSITLQIGVILSVFVVGYVMLKKKKED